MRVRKVDSNQAALVKKMRKIPGLSVAHTHTVGKGFPDLVIAFRNKTHLLEVKDPAKPPSARKLTEDEAEFHKNWTGEIHIVQTIDDVLKIISNQ